MSAGQPALIRDTWLTETLGREVYRLDATAGRELDALDRALNSVPPAPVFVYAKVPTSDLRTVAWLEGRGFHLIDTAIMLAKSVSVQKPAPGRSLVRPARAEDRGAVVALARTAFVSSRFHLDVAIPNALADAVKARWADSFFAGRRGEALLVAVVEGAIVGFNLLIHAPDGVMVIDLIAVGGDYRGRGIAGDLIAAAESQAFAFTEIRVGTQLANRASVRCYERLGFRLQESQYVFHYHRPVGVWP